MKLAIITNYWLKSQGGGIREYTRHFVKHLKQRGIDVTVIFRRGEDNDNHKLPTDKKEFAAGALDILEEEKPDIILCQGGWFTALPVVKFKKKNKDTKTAYLFHSHYDWKMPIHKRLAWNRLLNGLDAIGFVSKGLKRNIEDIGGLKFKTRTFILYAGVEAIQPTEEALASYRKEFNIDHNNIYLLGLGLTALKAKKEGAKLLMQAMTRVIPMHPNIRLILTRDGEFAKELKDYSNKLGINDHIIFTGDLESPYPAIVEADIYTHISFGDGLPIALLEAMAFGKPIIGSDIAGIPEAVTHEKDGIIVKNDVGSITEAIMELIKDEGLRLKYGTEIKKRAEEDFRWDKTVNEFLDVFN